MKCLKYVVPVLLAAPAGVEAQQVGIAVRKNASGWVCQQPITEDLPGNVRVLVSLEPLQTSGVALKASYPTPNGDTASASLEPSGSNFAITIPRGQIAAAGQLTLSGSIGGVALTCEPFGVSPVVPAPGSGNARQQAPSVTELDAAAQKWLQDNRKAVADMNLPPRTDALIHLPSGRVAGGSVASLSERREYQIALIVDLRQQNWSADITVDSCPNREAFRILGNLKEIAGQLQGAEEPQFALLAVQQPLSCGAGTMKYTMTVSVDGTARAPQKTNWRVRPVYHVAATYAMGFDFGERPAYSVVGGKIAETVDQGGPSQRVGFTWFPGGVDYERMTLFNRVINPFLLFSLDAPKESFVVGTTLTVTGGLSIAVGMSVEKVSVLKGGARVGDSVTGEAPVEKQWTDKSQGWYIGFTLDQNLLKALKGMMPGGKKETTP